MAKKAKPSKKVRQVSTKKPPFDLDSKKSEWQTKFQVTGQVARIQAVFEISKEANKLLLSNDKNEVTLAVRNAVGGDGKTATEILRLTTAFSKAELEKAKRGGLHVSHLLILTRVANNQKRRRYLNSSVNKNWSTKTLREKIRGQSVVQVPVRPTQLAKAIGAAAESLVEDLERLTSPEFSEGVSRVKRTDLADCNYRLEEAVARLEDLKSRLAGAFKSAKAAKKYVAERM